PVLAAPRAGVAFAASSASTGCFAFAAALAGGAERRVAVSAAATYALSRRSFTADEGANLGRQGGWGERRAVADRGHCSIVTTKAVPRCRHTASDGPFSRVPAGRSPEHDSVRFFGLPLVADPLGGRGGRADDAGLVLQRGGDHLGADL